MAQDPQIHEILIRTDLVELIGHSVKLVRSGRSFKGLCPFHGEKTPSFHVYPSDGVKTGFYHCYGCKASGDALSFLQNHEGLTFPEALEQLASRAGIELRRRSGAPGESKEKRKSRFEIMDRCQSHYRSNLRSAEKGGKAQDYLKQRRISPELIDRFGIGYALDEWEATKRLFQSSQESLDLALSLSLLKKHEERGSVYDFFRDRLMFPIHGPAGQLVAFAGRDLSGETGAKYVNTAETDLFKKGRVLYGLHQAKDKIRETKRAVLVEGYFDVIRMSACGFEETVAPMGTAVTPEQMALLERMADEVVLLFDGDTAGVGAALRSLEQAWNRKIGVRVAHLPEGVDPDDFLLAHPAEEMESLLETARPAFGYRVERAIAAHGIENAEGIRRVVDDVFESIANMESQWQVDLHLKEFAERVRVDYSSIRRDWENRSRELERRKGPGASEEGPGAPLPARIRPTASDEAERGLLALLLSPEKELNRSMGETFSSHPEARKYLGEALKTLESGSRDSGLERAIRLYLEKGPEQTRLVWEEQEDDGLKWEMEASLREGRVLENPLRFLRDYTHTLKRTEIDRRISDCKSEILAAERSEDWERVGHLAEELQGLARDRERMLSEMIEEVG